MGYLGTPIDTNNTFQSLIGKRFNGDGSETEFTLDIAPSSVLDIEVFIENVRQDPNSAYALSGTTMTFTSAPPSGTNNIYVVHQAKAVGTIEVPATYKSDAQTISGARTFNGGITMGGTTPTLTIGDAGAEDTKIVFDGNAQDYHIGLDDTDDSIKIGLGSALGTTAHIISDAAGHVTLPKQSGFQAKTASAQENLAIDAFVTLLFATEISDTNADYNTSNSTFTAPVTGKYLVTTALNFDALDADATYWQTQIKTSNREYTKLDSGNQYDADPTSLGHSQSMVVDMDASDTCIIRWYQGGGTAQADLRVESFFAMQLLA